jgi:hypothetical protein
MFPMSLRWRREYRQGRERVEARIKALRRQKRIASDKWPLSMYGREQQRSGGVFQDRCLEGPIESYFRKPISESAKVLRVVHERHLPVFFRCAISLVVIRVCSAIALDLIFTLSEGHGSVVIRKTNTRSMSK